MERCVSWNLFRRDVKNLSEDDYHPQINGVVKNLPRVSRILVAGCGLGRWVLYLNELGFDVVGVDIVRQAVRRSHSYARQHRHPPQYTIADVTALPFRHDVFNLILSLGVIEHFHRKMRTHIIKEAFRCLQRHGIFFCSVPSKLNLAHTVVRILLRATKKWKAGLEEFLGKRTCKISRNRRVPNNLCKDFRVQICK